MSSPLKMGGRPTRAKLRRLASTTGPYPWPPAPAVPPGVARGAPLPGRVEARAFGAVQADGRGVSAAVGLVDADHAVAVGRAVAFECVDEAARRERSAVSAVRRGARVSGVASRVGCSVACVALPRCVGCGVDVGCSAAAAPARTSTAGPDGCAARAARRIRSGAYAGRPGCSARRNRISSRWLRLRIEIGPTSAKTWAEYNEPRKKSPAHPSVFITFSR